MTPEILTIENLNSFTDKQTVDFTALGGDRLFCICGDTGAGKTTVLDAIIIALYGIPRENTTSRSGKDDFINVTADRAAVSFSFRMPDGKSYRVERTYMRSGANKTYLYADDALVEQGADAVNAAVENIVGLTRDEFTQVIILQQGAFSRFLTAVDKERTETVSKLFKLSKFDLSERVNKRVSELDADLRELNARLEPLESLTEKALAEKKRQLKSRKAALKENEQKTSEAEKRYAALVEDKKKYDAYLIAEAERVRCEAAYHAATQTLAAATAVPQAELDQAAEQAEQAAKAAAEKLDDFFRKRKAEENRQKLYLAREKMRADYRVAADEEKKLSAERDALQKQVDELRAQAAATVERANAAAEALGLEGGDLSALAKIANEQAGRLSEQSKSYEEAARKRQTAVETAERLQAERAAAAAAFEQALRAAEASKAALENERRANAVASVLEGLSDGDPCPVCGGTVKKRDVVSDVERAAARYAAAEQERSKCAERLTQLDEQIKNAQAAAQVMPEKPSDPQPFAALAASAEQAAKVERERAAIEKRLTEVEGKRAAATERKDGLAERGCDAGKNINCFKDEAGEYGEKSAEYLDRVQKQLTEEVAAAEKDASQKRARAKSAGETANKAAIEKAKAETALAAATRAAVAAPEVAADAIENAAKQIGALKEVGKELQRAVGSDEKQIGDDQENLQKKKVLAKQKADLECKRDVADRLSKLLKGKALVKFVAEEYIRAFTAAASDRLNRLSSGKYTLSYKDGVFSIGDYLNGNKQRRVVTLSGGETFLASLSMAAAISDMLASGVGYGFFFLDEGFGTLDESRLEQVFDALEKLSADTLVGVVTHSQPLIERIPARITVLPADGERGSRIV